MRRIAILSLSSALILLSQSPQASISGVIPPELGQVLMQPVIEAVRFTAAPGAYRRQAAAAPTANSAKLTGGRPVTSRTSSLSTPSAPERCAWT